MVKYRRNSMSHFIDEFASDVPDFSKAICLRLDELIHTAAPDIQEGKKWQFAAYWTEKGLVCGMYAAKAFVTFTFYDGALMQDAKKLFNYGDVNARNRSIKFTTVQDVGKHEKDILSYIQEAVENSKKGLKTKVSEQTITVPKDLKQALQQAGLYERFEAQTYTMRKEYIVWVEDAKKEETRKRRIEKALSNIAKGSEMYEKYTK